MLGDEVEQSGRMFDQKGAQLHAYDDDDPNASFKLQYYDEFGRKMTQKQVILHEQASAAHACTRLCRTTLHRSAFP